MGGKFFPGEHTIFLNIPLAGDPLSNDPVKVCDHKITLVGLGGPYQGTGGVGSDPVIAVQKLEIGAPGQVKGRVPGVRDTGIFLVDDPDTAVPFGIGVADDAGAVPASVIYQKQFKIRVLLVQNTLNAAANGVGCVVNRNDDADSWGHGTTPLYG